MERTWRVGDDRLIAEVALNVHRKTIGGLVTARAVLVQRLHHDPVQVAAQQMNQLWRVGMAMVRGRPQRLGSHRAQAGRGAGRFLLANGAAHFVQTGSQKLSVAERGGAGCARGGRRGAQPAWWGSSSKRRTSAIFRRSTTGPRFVARSKIENPSQPESHLSMKMVVGTVSSTSATVLAQCWPVSTPALHHGPAGARITR